MGDQGLPLAFPVDAHDIVAFKRSLIMTVELFVVTKESFKLHFCFNL
jgi:hypothetical protein